MLCQTAPIGDCFKNQYLSWFITVLELMKKRHSQNGNKSATQSMCILTRCPEQLIKDNAMKTGSMVFF